jgi:hypothetical protein
MVTPLVPSFFSCCILPIYNPCAIVVQTNMSQKARGASPRCAEEGLSPHTRRVIGVALKRRSRLLPQRGGKHLPRRPGMERVGRSDVVVRFMLRRVGGGYVTLQATRSHKHAAHTLLKVELTVGPAAIVRVGGVPSSAAQKKQQRRRRRAILLRRSPGPRRCLRNTWILIPPSHPRTGDEDHLGGWRSSTSFFLRKRTEG